jgi:hypothetical protein
LGLVDGSTLTRWGARQLALSEAEMKRNFQPAFFIGWTHRFKGVRSGSRSLLCPATAPYLAQAAHRTASGIRG